MKNRTPWGLLISGLVVVSLLLSACTTDNKASVQPLKNIPGGVDGPHVQEASANSATIVFTSGVPVVCNVAYGNDKNYGKLAVIPMAGAVTQHELLLTGLEPNATYHYRAKVTDHAGNIYQSDDLTFRTSETVEKAKPTGRNVAAAVSGARISGVSSNWGGGDLASSFGGNKAIDGGSHTAWSSNGDGNDAWIEIELSQRYEINAIGFWTRTMGNSAQISSFKVITDGGQTFGPFELPDALTMYYFDIQAKAQRLRFEVEQSSGGNTGTVEIEVYSP
ncbi:MAG: discoidin domain-containing protein [Chloroflexi bacterium]|nr:discoidin domain-containing protein [Chloroflexota bacterium]